MIIAQQGLSLLLPFNLSSGKAQEASSQDPGSIPGRVASFDPCLNLPVSSLTPHRSVTST